MTMHNSSPATPEERFWTLAAELSATDSRVIEGTIMKYRCLRVGHEFLALFDRKLESLVVKLPSERVRSLIEAGEAHPFAPAGRRFREWVAVPAARSQEWTRLLREGVAHAGARGAGA